MKYLLEDIKKTLLLLILIGISASLFAQSDIPNRPTPPRLVNDFTNTLSRGEIMSLERKLVTFNDTSSNQITVVLVSDLKGYEVADFTERLGDKWGVGRKGLNNGIVVLVKPKTRTSGGQVHIAIGYGLDGAIPDAISKRIIEHEMIPYFRENDYYSGLEKSTNVLMSLAAGEYNSDEYIKKTKGGNGGFAFVPFFIIFLIFYLVLRSGSRSNTMGRRGGSGLWTALFLGSMMSSGGRSSGSWSSFSGGSGGFGGFGGGGFGGGGASGSW